MTHGFSKLDLFLPQTRRRVCRIRVGRGALDALVEELGREFANRLLVIVSDGNVAPLHAEPLCATLRDRGRCCELLGFPAGESGKTRETKAALEDRLHRLGAERDTILIAVGGGVTGDLAGFVASTWHRGVPVIQVPTSLLAMVDAAVGGKTAVNLAGGKNLVGSFHQPWGIYADTSTLSTLPDRDYIDGFAEAIKSAAIGDVAFFRRLEGSVDALRRRDREAIEQVVLRCVAIKSRVVKRDERDAGRRAILNFGHTVAHALETVSGYHMRHGPAVAVGMCVEARLAVGETGFPEAHVRRLEGLIRAMGLPSALPAELSPDALAQATYHDKKVSRGRVRYALPVRLGRMLPGDEVTRPVAESRLRQVLGQSMP